MFQNYEQKILMVGGVDTIGLYMLSEHTGSVASESSKNIGNGTYSNITLNNSRDGIDGRAKILGNGSDSSVDIYSAALNTLWPRGANGDYSALAWIRYTAAGHWGDGFKRIITIQQDANNMFVLEQRNGADQIDARFTHNGDTDPVAYISPDQRTTWISIIATFNESAQEGKIYIDGSLKTTETVDGIWQAGALDSNFCCFCCLDLITLNRDWQDEVGPIALFKRTLSLEDVYQLSNI